MNAERRSYRARWVFPGDAEPIESGTVEIEAGRITAVHDRDDPRAEDLGNVAVVPALVNAHTHLEFSDLREPLQPDTSFADWIRAVVAHRRTRKSDPWTVINQGLQEGAQTGCTTLGEIATTDWPAGPSPDTPQEARRASKGVPRLRGGLGVRGGPRLVVFRELIGLLPEQIEPQLEIARQHLTHGGERTSLPEESGRPIGSPLVALGSPLPIRGLSPHAPYSVHPELFHSVIELAAEFRAPVAIHLAESLAELELLNHGTGELVRLREEFGVWRDDAIPRGTQPFDYLKPLADLDRALIIHGNYLSADELDFVAQRPNLSVVYCPRTHAFFGHREHPWRELLERGASVAIGTDSRASNPDLSLWRELIFLRTRFPDVDPATLLTLGTLSGARALGLEPQTGSLTPGKSADLAVVSLAAAQGSDPISRLFDSRHRVIGTMLAGRWLFH